MIVLDASVVVDVLTERMRPKALHDMTRGSEVIAPAHAPAEAMSAIGRLHRARALSEEEATKALATLATFPIELVPVAELIVDAWQLRHNLSLTDALYVALARQRDASLLTVDERLAAAAPDVAQLPD